MPPNRSIRENYIRLCIYFFQPRNQFGSQDTITVVEDREVRHCNWVRFLKYSTSPADVNIVGIKIKDEIIFQTVKKILPNEEIVAYLQDPAAENTPKFTTYEPNKGRFWAMLLCHKHALPWLIMVVIITITSVINIIIIISCSSGSNSGDNRSSSINRHEKVSLGMCLEWK